MFGFNVCAVCVCVCVTTLTHLNRQVDKAGGKR